MGGSVNPIEWILPPVALNHMLASEISQAAGGSSLDAPGSPNARRAAAEEEQQKQLADQQAEQAKRISEMPRPQTPFEELEARKRARRISQSLGNQSRSASQTLTTADDSLAGVRY